MSIMEILFIGGVVWTLLSILSFGYQGVQFLRYRKQLDSLPMKKWKSKKKNRKLLRKRRQLSSQKQKSKKRFFIFLLFSLIIGGSSAYLSYYQSMNLSKGDANSVVKGYYLLRDFEKQVTLAKKAEEKEGKMQENIRYLATGLASYGTKSASGLNTKDGQLALNRYYNALKQLGMNASTQTNNFYGNEKLEEEFLTDIAKVKGYEEIAFEYYKVNTDAFKEESE